SITVFRRPLARTQRRVLRFQLRKALTKRADRLGNLVFAKARRDVLWTVPVEGFESQSENPLQFCFVGDVRHSLGQIQVRVERQLIDVNINLEARATGVVHQEKTTSLVRGEVTRADVL